MRYLLAHCATQPYELITFRNSGGFFCSKLAECFKAVNGLKQHQTLGQHDLSLATVVWVNVSAANNLTNRDRM